MARILVIDDDANIVRIVKDTLEEKGHQIISASNVQEGLTYIKNESFDLFVIDVMLSGKEVGFNICKILRDNPTTAHLPIIILTIQDEIDNKIKGFDSGADDYLIKPFSPKELSARVSSLLRRHKQTVMSPLTQLPGPILIEETIKYCIALHQPWAILYLDLDNFKAYNDVYGFVKGDAAIKMLSQIVIKKVEKLGNPRDFIGHIGGDDFIVITSPTRLNKICKSIIDEFDRKIPMLYSKEDREKGFILTTNRQGKIYKYPIMTLSIGVVTNEKKDFLSYLEVSEVLAEMKKYAKGMKGSTYFKDRRVIKSKTQQLTIKKTKEKQAEAKERILVVDDETNIVKIVKDKLEDEGYEVTTACNGKEALLKVEKKLPDLILLDRMMPEMDGDEVCRILRENARSSSIPIIMFTALTQEEEIVKGLHMGADDYITKPFSPREMVLRVKALLNRVKREK